MKPDILKLAEREVHRTNSCFDVEVLSSEKYVVNLVAVFEFANARRSAM